MLKRIVLISLVMLAICNNKPCNAERSKANMENLSREEICKKNYEELFQSEWNPNIGTDPEMMNILQKYIFGEVFAVGNLDNKTREMLTVTSLTVQQTLPQLKAHIKALLNTGATPVEVREIIYQCAPFIGFPKTLNALTFLNEVFKERGIQTPLKSTATTAEQERFAKGSAIQTPIYGNEIEESMKGLPKNMGKDVSRFLTEVCFGDFYTREGLDIKTRELLVISILVTTGNTSVLKSHIKGNLKIGNSKETVTAAIIQCLPYVGFPNTLSVLTAAKEVFNSNK